MSESHSQSMGDSSSSSSSSSVMQEGAQGDTERQHDSSTTASVTYAEHSADASTEKPSTPSGDDAAAAAAAASTGGAPSPGLEASNAALHARMLGAHTVSAPNSLPNSAPASVPSSPPHHASLIDDDELARLKSQISELTSQVTSLNGKLVQSYNRVGGLEDDMHGRNMEVKDLQGKVEKLEAERKTWEERYEGGLLVEKDHVQTELSRMMDRVIEETASRGKAENDKAAIERELAELSSSLFAEANSMVAIERMERLRAERKMEELDRNLKDTESLMTSQGDQMRDLGGKIDELETEREELKKRLEELEAAALARQAEEDEAAAANSSMISIRSEATDPPRTPVSATPFSPQNGINSLQLALPPTAPAPTTPGSAISTLRALPPTIKHPIQYLAFDIPPFQEFVVFTKSLARIRKNITTRPIHDPQTHNPYAYGAYSAGFVGNPGSGTHTVGLSSSEQKEAMSNALPLTQYVDFPFVRRIMTEDSEPTLRLDNAPGLTYFSRGKVTNAIIDGNLAIEPAFTSIPSDQCAICGMSLAKFIASHQTTAPKDDPRKKLTRLATGWIPQAISGTATPTKEQQAERHKSSEWSISSLSDALQGALTPAKELGGFNFGIGGSDKPSEKTHGHYTPYTGGSGRPSTSSGAGSVPERRPSNLSRLSTMDNSPARPVTAGAEANNSTNNSHYGTFMLTTAAKQHVQIYLFRTLDSTTKYAICPTSCLPRLRAVCELWTYIRTIEKGLLSEDFPKFYPSTVGSSAGEYAQQVKKLTNSLVPPQSTTAIVKGLATPALGTSKQLGEPGTLAPAAAAAGSSAPPVLGGGLRGMAPLTKTTSNTSNKSETTGLGLDIEKHDLAYDASTNPSTESLGSTTGASQKTDGPTTTAATSVAASMENLSVQGQGEEGEADRDRTPNVEKDPLASSTSSAAGSATADSESRRGSLDQQTPASAGGNGDGFNLTLPPARPKRSTARGIATPTTASSSPMTTIPSVDANDSVTVTAPSPIPASPAATATGAPSIEHIPPSQHPTPKPSSPPQLPARTPSISGPSASAAAAAPASPAPATTGGTMLPPRLPARPALPKLSTATGPVGDKNAVAISTKDADWQQKCWYEIVRLKEVTFWARVGSTHDRENQQ